MLQERLTQIVGQIPICSHALRWYANRFPEGSVVKVRQGCASGLLWKRYHRYVNGYWIGHYELSMQQALARELKPADTFFDVGANAGFFTLIAARIIGPHGQCVAFDPSPENCASIREQMQLNGFQNCTVLQEAIADCEGTAAFSFATPGSAMGHLGASRPGECHLKVQTMSLDGAAKRFGRPNFVKMDIEGAEIQAMRGARQMLRDVRPIWLIELHGAECQRSVQRVLREANYAFFGLAGNALGETLGQHRHFIARPL